MPEIILPGTYISVRDEGLITAGRVSTGYIGIVGTANKGPVNSVQILGSLSEAREMFGDADASNATNALTLVRALDYVYANGGRTVYAVRTANGTPAKAAFQTKDAAAAANNLSKLEARSGGTWGNSIQIEINAGDAANTRRVEIYSDGAKEVYLVGLTDDFAKEINRRSALVTANESAAFVGKLPAVTTGKVRFGSDAAGGSTPGTNGENASTAHYAASLALLENDVINIIVLAGQAHGMAATLQAHLNTTAEIRRERIGIIGSNGTETIDAIVAAKDTMSSDRLIFVTPGIQVSDSEKLPGAYTAAAVAGLLSSLPVQASATNKTLTLPGLSVEFSSSKLEKLVQKNILAVEKREGFRVVKGITTASNSAWHQITTRRIVDYAIYGVRSACNPYIGKLNNERVRGAMKATLDAFLTRMTEDEALVSYELEVSATRAQEIAGECAVTMTIRPTFSIDFVRVTMYLG
jgi:hypothetical protein